MLVTFEGAEVELADNGDLILRMVMDELVELFTKLLHPGRVDLFRTGVDGYVVMGLIQSLFMHEVLNAG